MPIEVIMPKFGLSMEEGTIAAWLVQEGAAVKKGESLAQVESEKLTNDAQSPGDGVLVKILAPEGETLPCGARIAILAQPGEAWEQDAAPQPQAAPVAQRERAPANEQGPAATSVPAAAGDAKAISTITPRAKKLAEEKGLSYGHIQGTGIHGMITVEDLLAHGTPIAGKSEAAPAPAGVLPAVSGGAVKMSRMQAAVSRAMATSMAAAAQTTLTAHADVSGLAATYRALKGRYAAAGVKLTYTAMIVKAVAHALENHPAARTMTIDGKTQWTMDRMHIGVAVDVPQGLIVPVIRDADRKGLLDICREMEDLARRAREQRLAESEMGNAAMTVTNLGMFGVTYFTPILNLPESIILGVGTISDMPVARNGGLTIAPVLHLSLTHDHRVNNGAQLARFLAEVIASLNDFRWT